MDTQTHNQILVLLIYVDYAEFLNNSRESTYLAVPVDQITVSTLIKNISSEGILVLKYQCTIQLNRTINRVFNVSLISLFQ